MGGILTEGDGDAIFKRQELSGEAKWKDIEDLVRRWAKRNPRRFREMVVYNKEKLSDSMHNNQHGELKEEAMANGRAAISIDPELLNYIETFYPNIISTKESLHEFMKRMPGFNIRYKI